MKTKTFFLRNWMIAIVLVTLSVTVAAPPIVAHSGPAPASKSAGIVLERTYGGSVKLNWAVPGLYSDTLTAPTGELPDLGSLDLGFLVHCSGETLSGYVDLSSTLVFPGMSDITTADGTLTVGPAVSGTCSDASWVILSEQFEQAINKVTDKNGQVIDPGKIVKRQFQLIGALDAASKTYKGEYRETLWGYSPQPITVVGDFELLLANPPTNVDSAPKVVSSNRANPSPTSKKSVAYTVKFSEAVTGVDKTDFALTKTGAITGYSVASVTGSGATYTVAVNTGAGNGTLRLDVLKNGSIKDVEGNTLSAAFVTGQIYTVKKVLTFVSQAANDGWILETGEKTNLGGTLNATADSLNLGDDAANKQYRGVLSFSTASLPDNAVITKITLKMTKKAITGGGNPTATFQGFLVDVKKGFIGTAATLQAADFQTPVAPTLTIPSVTPVGNVYSLNLTNGKAAINLATANGGLTQIRLRFKLDDNNNKVANFISFFSANTTTAANRPQLIIEYYVP